MPDVKNALDIAAQGFCIFPVTEFEKHPPLLKWTSESSSAEAVIHEWWGRWPNANIGIDCGKSGVLVLDIDPSRGGADSLDDLELEHGPLPDTRVTVTPSGGRHIFFRCSEKLKNSIDEFAKGIDIRSQGGYVVGPWSETEAGAYAWNDIDVADVPEWVLDRCSRSTLRTTTAEVVPFTKPVNNQVVQDYLSNTAPAAVEGQGGDLTTYEVACRVRDYGVTEQDAFALMTLWYNERCQPPWSESDLRRKVKNAYTYGQNATGSKAATEDFDAVEPVDDDKNPLPEETLLDPDKYGRREWVLGHRYMKSALTLTVAPGGEGKSTLVIAEALAIATGQPITGQPVHVCGPVYYYNTEDSREEISRRFHAAALFHNLDWDLVKQNVKIASGQDRPLELAREQAGAVQLSKDFDRLRKVIHEKRYVLLLLDPFVSTHNVNENDNRAIQKVVHSLTRIAVSENMAVGVVHHARKGGQPGDQDSARGASSFMAAARIAHTLSVMGLPEARQLGITDRERRSYLRLDTTKANFSPPAVSATWFKKSGFNLASGDQIGCLEPVDFDGREVVQTVDEANEKYLIATILVPFIQKHTKDASLSSAVRFLITTKPELYGTVNPLTLRSRIEKYFITPAEVEDDVVVHLVYSPTGRMKYRFKLTKKKGEEQ